ncbi:MAG: hypothetical protein E6L02_00075 [Thaumarchaeota archaeon]|nr:MAG: hypothetical protein E6L02_00075 [Nitrososphaerota archaeon]
MQRPNITQKQYEIPQRNKLVTKVSIGYAGLEPSSIIKTMIKIIKMSSKDSMDKETRKQFSKITDAVIRMAEEIRE